MSASHHPGYEYSPLQGNEIRLVRLQPGNFDEDLRLEIIHYGFEIPAEYAQTTRVAVSDDPPLPTAWRAFRTPEGQSLYWRQGTRSRQEAYTYTRPRAGRNTSVALASITRHEFEALSYTWGDASNPQTALIVENFEHKQFLSSLRIGQNLATALRHLRLSDNRRTLWVDAVCINQNELEERAAQVKRMRHIYGLATGVVIWLGEASQKSAAAFDILRYLGQQIEITDECWKFPSFDPPASEPSWFDTQVVLPYKESEWQAIEELFERPWFDRLWVLQEVMANPITTFQCGHHSLDWYYLRRAIAALDERAGVPAALSYRVNNKINVAYGSRVDLRGVIFISRQHLCQDPRDKLYGVLGLFGPTLQKKISPSYQDSFEEVYREAFLMHSETTGRLDLLTQCFHNGDRLAWSSWIPDWRSYPAEFRIPEPGYQASGASKAEFRQTPDLLLEATGILHDRVAKVFDAADGEVESLIDCIRQLCPDGLHTSEYITGEPALKAWVRTLALDVLQERFLDRTLLTYAEWEKTVLGIVGDEVNDDAVSDLENASNLIRDTLTDMLFFRTERGYFGFGPFTMQPGDFTCVLLGAPTPVVIRPCSGGYHHQVIGWSYVHGLMDSEILLGPLPRGWIVVQRDVDLRSLPRYVDVAKNWWQFEEPRLGAVPEGWERLSGRKSTGDDPVVVDYFENKETAEVINYDPRMAAEALQARGVSLVTLTFE